MGLSFRYSPRSLQAGFFGSVNGVVTSFFNIPSFITTLASLSMLRGLALIITDTQNLYGFNAAFKYVGAGSVAGLPIIVWMFLLLLAAAYIFQQHSPFARHMYAVGGDRRAAALFNISIRRVEVVLFALSGAIAGLAGAVLAARVASAEPNAGIGFELTSIAAVIIGGTSLTGGEGGVQRTFVGVLILGVISNGLNLLAVPSYYQQVVAGFVIVLAVILDQWPSAAPEARVPGSACYPALLSLGRAGAGMPGRAVAADEEWRQSMM